MAHAIYQFWGAGEMNLKKQNKQKNLLHWLVQVWNAHLGR